MGKGDVHVDVLDRECVWTLKPEDFTQVDRGEMMSSGWFELDPVLRKMQLQFYPKGRADAEEGRCSLFVQRNADIPVALRYRLQIGAIELKGHRVFRVNGHGWGYQNFCAAPAQGTLTISITILDAKTTRDLPELLRVADGDGQDAAAARESLSVLIQSEECAAEVFRWTRELEDLNKKVENQEADLSATAQEMKVAKQETADCKAAMAKQGQRLEFLEAVLDKKPCSPNKRCEASAATVQRAWRRTLCKARESRARAERLRRLRHLWQESCVVALQRRWRKRQVRLQQRREEVERQRKGSHGSKADYDAIFTFQSLSEFITSKHISMLRSPASLLNLAVEAQYRIVAVVGLYDKGKTFLINKLFGTNLPSGKLFSTKGLSFFWVADRRMLVLDTAGVQGMVSYRAEAVQPILDAQTTESLVFEMISRIAHHLIFVVNDLTWFEQKYIAMLHQKYVQSHQAKELIVVHNLRTTSLVKEARELFTRQITQCYEGQTSHLAELTFTSELGNGGPYVHHVGICDEATAAGEKFNDVNCKLIMDMLELRDMLGSRVMLPRLLRDELVRLLPVFLNVELPECAAPKPELNVDYVPAEASAGTLVEADAAGGYVEAGKFVLCSSPESGRISMKTRGVISPLGEIIAHDVTFQPLVNVYDQTHDHEVKRVIEIECPGVAEEDIEFEEMANGIKVVIEKQKAIDEVLVQPVTPIRQHHGRWEQEFAFESSEGKFEFCGDEVMLEGGVLRILLRRQVQARKWRLGGRTSSARGSNGAAAVPTQASPVAPPATTSPRSTISTSGFSHVESLLS